MKMKRIVISGSLILAGIFYGSNIHAFAPTNFFTPDQTLVRISHVKGASTKLGAYLEAGSKTQGVNWDSQQRNVLALHDDIQKSAHMLLNPVSHFPTGGLGGQIAEASDGYRVAYSNIPDPDGHGMIDVAAGGNANFDPVGANAGKDRGLVTFEGDFAGYGLTLYAAKALDFIKIPGNFTAEVFLPAASRRVRNVRFTDKTIIVDINHDAAAQRFNANLASNMHQHFGQDLSATDVNGIGDLAAFVNYHYSHKIKKQYLHKVCFFARLGVTAPTGTGSHTEKPFRMALGNDGAWGLPFNLGTKVSLLKKLAVGVAFDGLVLSDDTKTRRVKTSKYQSEFMLINKARVQKDHGFTYNISPYLNLYKFGKGFSAKLAYQFSHHSSDKLVFKDDAFRSVLAAQLAVAAGNGSLPAFGEGGTPESVINSANSLKRWDVHNIIAQLTWEIARDAQEAPGAPQIGIFYKRPISARNMIDTDTFGGHLSFNF